MKKILRYIILLIVILTGSCEEPIDCNPEKQFVPRLVVEAFLTNQPGYNYVKLTLPVFFPGDQPRSVTGAIVVLSDGENQHLLREDAKSPGIYITEESVRGVVNKIYALYIKVDSYEFIAHAAMIPVGPLGEFSYRETSDGSYIINPSGGSDPSMIRYIVEWADSTGNREAVFYHYRLESVDVNEFFKPSAETLTFPSGAKLVRQKYSLTPDHQQYIRSLLSETEWKGGWFDVLPGNLHTNLSAGAVGYFAACSVVADTVWIE